MKKILAILFALSCGTAFADDRAAIHVSHPTHDTIACAAEQNYSNRCESVKDKDGHYVAFTPAQYAGNAGYKFIHKQSVVIVNGYRYIIMEVSK